MEISTRLQLSNPSLVRGLSAAAALVAALALPGLAEAKKPVGEVVHFDTNVIQGWTCDPDNFAYQIDVVVYQEGQFIGQTTADIDWGENKVWSKCGFNHAAHVFSVEWPVWMHYEEFAGEGGAWHNVKVYAVDNQDGSWHELNNLAGKKVSRVWVAEEPTTRPDLTVETMQFNRLSPTKGVVSYLVCNRGVRSNFRGVYQTDLSFHNQLWVSCNVTPTGFEDKVAPGGIEPGNCVQMKRTVSIPAATPHCDFSVTTDSRGKFRELNEDNNVLFTHFPL
jgi:hypothetical protein